MKSGNRIISDIPLIWSEDIVIMPEWLKPYLEKEYAEQWQFYKKGADFTDEQYTELGQLTYTRTPEMTYNNQFAGVQIRLYKRISVNNIMP